MDYQPTDRYQNWFITSLQTDINDTTASFRLNKALSVQQGRLVIDPFDESNREIVKVTSVDGTLVYVERGDDHTAPAYHNEGAIVVMEVFAADLNDLYADWALAQVDLQEQQDAFEAAQTLRQDNFEAAMQTQQDDFEAAVTTQITDVEALAFLAAHPVDSLFVTESNVNPSGVYGGTWELLEEPVERRLVATKVLHWSGSGTGTTSRAHRLGVYSYDMLTLMLDTNTGVIDVPDGWHVEYKMQGEVSTDGANTVRLYLNNMYTKYKGTYSTDTFRVTVSTDFFRKEDIILETTTGYSTAGINFGWQSNSNSGTIRVYLPTLSAYLVRDDPIYKWKRTA